MIVINQLHPPLHKDPADSLPPTDQHGARPWARYRDLALGADFGAKGNGGRLRESEMAEPGGREVQNIDDFNFDTASEQSFCPETKMMTQKVRPGGGGGGVGGGGAVGAAGAAGSRNSAGAGSPPTGPPARGRARSLTRLRLPTHLRPPTFSPRSRTRTSASHRLATTRLSTRGSGRRSSRGRGTSTTSAAARPGGGAPGARATTPTLGRDCALTPRSPGGSSRRTLPSTSRS